MPQPLSGPQLVILLHGFGSNGQKWEPLIGLWRTLLPRSEFVAPNGMFECHTGGYRWFDDGASRESSPCERVVAGRPAFDAMLSRILTAHGLRDRQERVALAGFSQGATMALDAVASGRWHLAAVVGFAGRLCSPEPLLPATDTAVSIIHGAADPVVPEAEGQKTAVALRRHGVRVERHVVDGELHGITRDGAEIAASFLHRALQNRPAPWKSSLLGGNSSRSGQRHQGTPGR